MSSAWADSRTALDKRLDTYLGVPWESAGVLEIASAFEALGHADVAEVFRRMWESGDDFRARAARPAKRSAGDPAELGG